MILLQFISLQFALASAFHDAPAINQFEFGGVKSNELRTFHRNNWYMKLLFVFVIGLVGFPNLRECIYGVLLSGLWVYLVFDIALNLSRFPRKTWDYLGLNDDNGKFWNGLFGRNAGKIKAIVLFGAIVFLNYLYYA